MAAKLSRADVLRIAGLAHLTLTEAEVETFGRQLAGILDWVDEIQQADTAGVEPTSHVSRDTQIWRDDELTPSLERDDVLGSAPDADFKDGLFRVPRVL
ncbi:MAG TPA: Asp-tRNA(Asn)/Glu-tRNA(Gln) amidotransferase subunit GatC [Vicinamibacterales bacterium]|nr:Asp-tRNA(Asn)/Glu-tRNA(Gln) amidotransferase subunit GatC [Vicinamibacterales bacterium]